MTKNNIINADLEYYKKLVHLELIQQKQSEMIKRRNHLIQFDINAPKYLLEPEIKQFFDFVDNYNELMLFKLLWITGARINEALLLTPANFIFGIDSCLKKFLPCAKNGLKSVISLPLSISDCLPSTSRTIVDASIFSL